MTARRLISSGSPFEKAWGYSRAVVDGDMIFVSGTTGYDYLNFANRVMVNPEGAKEIERIYSEFVGRKMKFNDVLYEKKKLVMGTILGVEMRSLGRQLGELAAQARYARDLPRHELSEALIETTACFAVYRTYIRNLDLPAAATKVLEEALAEARRTMHPRASCEEVPSHFNGPRSRASSRTA